MAARKGRGGIAMHEKRYHPPTEAEKTAFRDQLQTHLDGRGLVLTEAAQTARASVELGATSVATTDTQATMTRADGFVFAYAINVELTPAILIATAIEAFSQGTRGR